MSETFDERQKRENAETYKRWLACGFPKEAKYNDAGWMVTVLRLFYPVKRMQVLKAKTADAEIEYAQLPNGKWVAASCLSTKIGCVYGYGSAVSIYDKQYDTKAEAIYAELENIEDGFRQADKKALTPEIKTTLTRYKNEFGNASVFDAFFGAGASFEQTSLFDVA